MAKHNAAETKWNINKEKWEKLEDYHIDNIKREATSKKKKKNYEMKRDRNTV